MKPLVLLFSIICTFAGSVLGQEVPEKKPRKKKSKLQAGLALGAYFANNYSARLYDGYGYDADGKRNDFGNSFMFRKIVMELGGGWGGGQTDYVAQALGVNPGEWSFDQTDMPLEMKYSPAFSVGLQLLFSLTKKDALLLQVNATRVNAHGNFTIVVTAPPIGPQPPGYQDIRTFGITGGEQRISICPAYQRILGDDDVINGFWEIGPVLNSTEYSGNRASINGLTIDLSQFYTQNYYPTYRARYLRGWGYGLFTTLGVKIKANDSWNIDLLYSPSFEKVNIGENPVFKPQHSGGMRVLYNL